MPKHPDIHKVLVIGSGPIIIGQAAEFDYAGTQACRALREEGVKSVLLNSNPATIMTDKDVADCVYIEPMTIDTVKKIIQTEKPDSILPSLGGQTGLNLCMALVDDGFLEQSGVRLIGMKADTIYKAEDRKAFKQTMESIGEPCIQSTVVETVEDALSYAETIEYPVIVRPAYTLGGTGGGIAANEEELRVIAKTGLRTSRVHQVLIEKCVSGWKEIEYEVLRDSAGNCIMVCSMENIDPVGIHTGDSIVVAPCQTLADKEYQMLRSASFNIITALGIEGGCNVQFALNPDSFEYAVIEVNPRVSRSSALASKAAGYPIAKVTTKIALGLTLDEIPNSVTGHTFASFEPTLDYCCVKIPKFPFDKFVTAKRKLGTQMKATGEVMAISPSFEGALLKAVRSLESGFYSLASPKLQMLNDEQLLLKLHEVDDMRLFCIAEAIRRGLTLEHIHRITTIDVWFLDKIRNIINMEIRMQQTGLESELIREAKNIGYPDVAIAKLLEISIEEVESFCTDHNIRPVFKMVDTCAAEFDAQTPYYYSCYGLENEVDPNSDKKKVLVLGSGPIRIGQGIEFDYCSVHSAWALSESGFETVIINNNPETVSTDFDISDKLYFEPLTTEDVRQIVELEKPYGAVVQFGGQTAIKLAKPLEKMGVKILGTSADDVDAAEDRERFDAILEQCKILRPRGFTVFTYEEAVFAARKLGYPVLVRPSYVLGGQGMQIAWNDQDVGEFMDIIWRTEQDHPILVDKYVMGRELEVDAVCDGTDVLIPGIMEHMERAGVHSGDSISVYPPQNLAESHRDRIVDYTRKLAKALHVTGMINIQFIIKDDDVYVIEVNPRSSRTVPYISKITGIPIVKLATQAILGQSIPKQGYSYGLQPEHEYICIKMPVFSFEKLYGAEVSLGPEMKSTGEVLGVSKDFSKALCKAFLATGVLPIKGKKIMATVRDFDKAELVPIAKRFINLGFSFYATEGTAAYLVQNGVAAEPILKEGQQGPGIGEVEMLQSGEIGLAIMTPTQVGASKKDGFLARRIAVETGVPCLTSLDTASALLDALENSAMDDLEIIDLAKI